MEEFSRELPNLSGPAVCGELAAADWSFVLSNDQMTAGTVGTFMQSVPPTFVFNNGLRITPESIVYNGATIEDAGEVHRALLAAMNAPAPGAQLGGAAVRGEAVAWAVTAQRGGIHKLSITKDSADRKAAKWREEWPDNGCAVRPLVFGDAPVSGRAADAPSEPSVRRYDAYKLASRLQSFADRLCNDQTIGTRYEGDEADLRTAIHFIRSSGRAADALDSQPTDDGKLLFAMEFEAVELGYAGLAEAMAALRRMKADPDADREALIACLGDDAATLSHINPDDEMAQTMREAIAMLESDEVVIATLGMASSQPTDGGVRNGRAELAKLLAGAEPGDAT